MSAFKLYLKFIAVCFFVLLAAASCRNGDDNAMLLPPATVLHSPVITSLEFNSPIKLNWDAIAAVPMKPAVEKFSMDKFPSVKYDSIRFKPLVTPVVETPFKYDTLPGHDLDIDKLPTRPLTFKSYLLPPPKTIKAGPPHLKNQEQALYGFSGVLQGSVTTMITDHAGFLWIATKEGLYRYDGENLSLYIQFHGSDQVYSMMEDKQGRIWYNTQSNNFFVFDPAQHLLKMYKQGMPGVGVTRYLQDDKQRIWVTIYGSGVNIIDNDLKTVRWIGKNEGLSALWASGIARDIYKNIWIGLRGGGADIIDVKHKKVKYLAPSNGLKIDSVAALLADKEGRVWMGSYSKAEVTAVDIAKGSIYDIHDANFSNKSLWNLTEDGSGKVWIGTFDNGAVTIDPENWTTRHVDMKTGLNGSTIQSIVLDPKGQLWVASSTGLDMISDGLITEYIRNSGVSTFAEDDSRLLWDGIFSKGIAVINRADKTYRFLTAPGTLSNDSVRSISAQKSDIFICSHGGLDIIDSARTTLTHFNRRLGLAANSVYSAIADNSGVIWIAGYNGLDIYDPKNNTVKHLGPAQGLSNGVRDNLVCDKEGRIWVSNHTGPVTMIDPAAGTLQNLTIVPESKSPGSPAVLQMDKDGNVWIGSYKGIFIADVKHRTLTSFSTAQGLINNQVNSLIEHDGRMYVGTNEGISVITPPKTGVDTKDDWDVKSFGKSYGVNKTNPDAYLTDLMTKDGRYVWGDNGIFILDLSKDDTAHSATFISSIRVMDKPVSFNGRMPLKLNSTDTLYGQPVVEDAGHEESAPGELEHNHLKWDTISGPYNMPVNLRMPYNQNFVQFQFNSLNLSQRDNNQYRYILVGADPQWSDVTTEPNSQNYFNLVPGKYTFEVISRNINGSWSRPAKLAFVIKPPWWRTWWAYILFVFMFLVLMSGLVYLRSRQLIREKRVLEHKIQVRTEEVMQQKEEMEAQRDNLEKAFGELKSTQHQLVHAEKMASLGELTAGIAHEIQNPLNFVNNFSEVNTELIDELKEELEIGHVEEALAIVEDLKANEQKITMHGKRADSIVKGMLQHSSTGSGVKEPTDLNKLADEYVRLAYHGLRSKDKTFNAEIITRFDDSLPRVSVIPQDFGRVMLNLFTNAFYSVNQKRKISGPAYRSELIVTTHRQNGSVVISVKDNGMGIPTNIKEKIMQPFFTTKPTGEGTGLGLSLTYDMIKKGHGGSIHVNSEEGNGAEFVITLPLS